MHRTLRRELQTFYARCEESGRDLPKFVRREFDTFLGCGVLQYGFLRVRCQDCGDDRLVAFSCKGRGFCPSCTGRRMADTAAHLVDRVLPHVPVRQWVLSLPIQIRPMLAYDATLSRAVLNIFLRAVFAWHRRKAKLLGINGAQCGAVTSIQRFGSALNLNLHFHVLVLDGVFHQGGADASPSFRALKAPSTKEIAELTRKIQTRVVRLFERRGLFDDNRDVPDDEQALVGSYSASARGRIGFGENAGRLHQKLLSYAPTKPSKDKRAANISGFDLHANVRVKAADRPKLERLCRYILRPPLASTRLSETADGKILFAMKRRFDDGTTHIVFEPLDFIEKLVALIPKPRAHQVLYHGVLAPHANWRSLVILKPDDAKPAKGVGPTSTGAARSPPELRQRRLTWAELMRRVFAVDVLKCHVCGGPRTILSAITDPTVIRAILGCLGLPTTAKRQHPPRAPPQNELCFP